MNFEFGNCKVQFQLKIRSKDVRSFEKLNETVQNSSTNRLSNFFQKILAKSNQNFPKKYFKKYTKTRVLLFSHDKKRRRRQSP